MRSAISRCLTACAITCLTTGSNAAVADEAAAPAAQPASIKAEAPVPEAAQPASPASAKPDAAEPNDAVKPISRTELCEALAGAAKAHKLPVPFFIRLIWQESRF